MQTLKRWTFVLAPFTLFVVAFAGRTVGGS
jgi:hypothetical protein